MRNYIRAARLGLSDSNTGKLEKLRELLCEYRRCVQFFIDYLWDNPILTNTKDKTRYWDRQKNKLNIPKYLYNKNNKPNTWLSGRMVSNASDQAIAMVSAATRKRKKQLYQLAKMQRQGKNTTKLQKAIDSKPLIKPDTSKIKMDLNTKCFEFHEDLNTFDLWIRFKCLGMRSFWLPTRKTSVYNKWNKHGVRCNQILISEDTLDIRFRIKAKESVGDKVLGADTGQKTLLTLSNGCSTDEVEDPHGHTVQSVCNKLARKKRGSKLFQRTNRHLRNLTNWSLKQISWSSIKELRLEEIKDYGRGRRIARSLRFWKPAELQAKVEKIAEEHGVHVKLQSSPYRSCRCSDCGWVQKSNRHGKLFKCKCCGFVIDADLNAACNHSIDLEPLYRSRLSSERAKVGFYWLPDGQELRVPDTQKCIALQEKAKLITTLVPLELYPLSQRKLTMPYQQ